MKRIATLFIIYKDLHLYISHSWQQEHTLTYAYQNSLATSDPKRRHHWYALTPNKQRKTLTMKREKKQTKSLIAIYRNSYDRKKKVLSKWGYTSTTTTYKNGSNNIVVILLTFSPTWGGEQELVHNTQNQNYRRQNLQSSHLASGFYHSMEK